MTCPIERNVIDPTYSITSDKLQVVYGVLAHWVALPATECLCKNRGLLMLCYSLPGMLLPTTFHTMRACLCIEVGEYEQGLKLLGRTCQKLMAMRNNMFGPSERLKMRSL